MNFKLIEKLESTTPACPRCNGISRFVIGVGYELLDCSWCGLVFKAPKTLTSIIRAAYIPKTLGVNKRVRVPLL